MDVILYFSKVIEKPLWFRIPLGYLSLGSVLFHEGIKVMVIDGNYEKKIEAKIKKTVNSGDKFIFGISSMTGYQITDGLAVANFVRKNFPKALIVWGGWHPSLLPENTLKNELVDCIVIGPGEETLLELIKAFKNQKSYKNILGLGYKEKGEIRINNPRCDYNFNKLPPLKWDLLDLESYLMHDITSRTVTYISSRGCPFRCGFCAVKTVYKRKWYPLPVENVIEDIEFLINTYRIDGIRFEDSNFFTSKKRILQITEELLKKNLTLKWSALARPNDLLKYNKDELRLLKKSGLSQILVGAESADQDALNLIKKDIKAGIIYDLVKLCIKEDISIILSFMVGFPIAEGKDIDLTINLIKFLHSKYPFGEKNNEIFLFYYTPYPGSDLYQLALEKGFKEPSSLKYWADLTLNEFHAPWINKKQDRKIQKAMRTYQIIKFYIRAAEMLKNLNNTLKFKSGKFGAFFITKLIYAFFKFRISHKIYFLPLSRYIFYTFSKIPIFKFLKKLEGDQ